MDGPQGTTPVPAPTSTSGGAADGSDAPTPAESACHPSACGPAPGAPVETCADGSTAGPSCQPTRGGCGWVITKCPVTGRCEGLDKETCGRNAACDWISGGAPAGVGGPAGGCVPRSQSDGKPVVGGSVSVDGPQGATPVPAPDPASGGGAKGTGPAGAPMSTSTPTETACHPKACGPAPGAPVEICADGSTAGPSCQPTRQGCGWVITKCPVTGPCERLDKETCARNAACDWVSGGAPVGVGGPSGGCVSKVKSDGTPVVGGSITAGAR